MWQKNVRYLDYNAGSGLSDYVQQKLIETLSGKNREGEDFILANPSSRHRLGQRIKHDLYSAALKIARSLGEGVTPDHLLFTSSGTEASQTVIRSVSPDVEGMIIGSGEHSATYDLLQDSAVNSSFRKNAFGNSFHQVLPLLPSGQYDWLALKNLLTEAHSQQISSLLLSLFWANNETGVLTDLEALATIIAQSPVKIILHLDGAQVWGKIPLAVTATPAHYITFSAHKIGAPAGVGVIWARDAHVKTKALIIGAQNHGLRGGTENSLGIMALGFAAETIAPLEFIAQTNLLQKEFESALQQKFKTIQIWGAQSPRVSNTTRLSFSDFHAYENWVELLDLRGFAVSHGSACKSNVIEPSRVLLAMGASKTDALNSIRVSFGPKNTLDDVNQLVFALEQIYHQKMSQSARPVKNSPAALEADCP
jgi:cysteine desulfurase